MKIIYTHIQLLINNYTRAKDTICHFGTKLYILSLPNVVLFYYYIQNKCSIILVPNTVHCIQQ